MDARGIQFEVFWRKQIAQELREEGAEIAAAWVEEYRSER